MMDAIPIFTQVLNTPNIHNIVHMSVYRLQTYVNAVLIIVTCHSDGWYLCAVSGHKFSGKSHHVLQSSSTKVTPYHWNMIILITAVLTSLFSDHYWIRSRHCKTDMAILLCLVKTFCFLSLIVTLSWYFAMTLVHQISPDNNTRCKKVS